MLLNNPGDRVGEVFQIANSFGKVLEFNQAIYMPVYTSFGTPPISYQTRKGFDQDGSTLVGLLLQERALSIQIYHTPEISREAWWDLRRELINFFRAELGKPLTLTVLQAGGDKFFIDVFADPGITFDNFPSSNENDIDERIALRAFDPLWKKFGGVTLTLTGSEDSDLVFPFEFPVTFGSSGTIFNSGNLNYAGSWRSFPTITLNGPYSTASMLLVNKNILIELLTSIGAGEQRIITLESSNLSIVDENGDSKFDELSLPSNLKDFFIPASPEGLTEQIRITFLNGSLGISSAQITYFENYLGI